MQALQRAFLALESVTMPTGKRCRSRKHQKLRPKAPARSSFSLFGGRRLSREMSVDPPDFLIRVPRVQGRRAESGLSDSSGTMVPCGSCVARSRLWKGSVRASLALVLDASSKVSRQYVSSVDLSIHGRNRGLTCSKDGRALIIQRERVSARYSAQANGRCAGRPCR